MSSPVSLDYPDYTRTFASARNLLYLKLSSAIVAPEVSTVIVTGNMHSVGVKIIGNVNNVRITLDWFFDAGFTALVTTDNVEIIQNGTFDQTITCKGPFLRVTATPFPAGTCTYSVLLYEMPFDAATQLTAVSNYLITVNGSAVGAGATVNSDATRAFCGPAVMSIFSSDAVTWNGSLLALRADGTTLAIARADNKFPIQCLPVELPATTMRIAFTNNDAVGRFFFAFLAAKPLYP